MAPCQPTAKPPIRTVPTSMALPPLARSPEKAMTLGAEPVCRAAVTGWHGASPTIKRRKKMVQTTCDTCGGKLHWDWTEAFAKFGFGDGDGQVETWQVEAVLAGAGYAVKVEEWGCHNTVITSIKKDDLELIPHDNPKYTFGYDDPRAYFPAGLVRLLDEKFPPGEGLEFLW